MTEEISEKNILYELLIYAEWLQEPEIQTKGIFEKCDDKSDTGKCYGSKWWWLGPFSPEPCPSLLVQQLKNLQMSWTFAIGGNGAVVAILQDSSLEIRSSRDEYGAVIGRALVTKDPCPQWRKILWSPDCSMLALAHSNGTLDFYDLIGALMFTIDTEIASHAQCPQLNSAIVGMAFTDTRVKNTQWSYELIVSTYQGIITGYFISPSGGYSESHKFSLTPYYPNGITCFTYHSSSNILIISGKSYKLSSSSNDSSHMGISAWRLISGYPFYKLTVSMGEQMRFQDSNWWNFLSYYQMYKSFSQDLVHKSSISPDENILAAIHVSGALSLWDLPSLRLKKYWPLNLQPNFDDVHPQYHKPGLKKKSNPVLSSTLHSHLVDVNWWSNEAVILVRRCGAVTVSSISSLKNLLGISPEWFEPSPEVSVFCGRGFLSLEGETKIQSKKRALEDLDELENEESSDDEESSLISYTAELAQRALYFVTDSERFQPPRKKVKLIVKTYRLLCLKSTTPDELYTRKINNEEYGEALAIAKTYNLDCDLVYQRQWRKMPATVESIHDYLSKITKRSWVLHECIERVPENFVSAKELLLFGLRGTDLEALIAIGKGEDRGRFILCSPYNIEYQVECEETDHFNAHSQNNFYDEEALEENRRTQLKARDELIKQIDFNTLTLEQKQLCQCRLKLLAYLDKLTIYEMILGGSLMAEDQYDHLFFKNFRSQCGLESALQFACSSNWQAVATLFTYVGSETLSHRLSILSNFPETISPLEYQTLLPLLRKRDFDFCPWDIHQLREKDWSEVKFESDVGRLVTSDFEEEFYERYESLLKYRQNTLKISLVTEWFIERAQQIEKRCGLVENALDLIKLGIERNIKGLEKLYDDLLTLEVLVYDCRTEIEISFDKFQEMKDFEKIKLLMSDSIEESFIKNIKQFLLPFLSRCDGHVAGSAKSLFKNYVLSISKDSLIYCQKILENSKPDFVPNLYNVEEFTSLSLDCIYLCERDDQLKVANAVLSLITSMLQQFSRSSSQKIQTLYENTEQLRKHISVAELLIKNGTSVTLSVIKNICYIPEEIKKVLVKLTRLTSHRSSVIDESEWKSLLSDILEMQDKLFTCLSQEDCLEIVLHSLLCSGKQEGISLAGKMMECNKKQQKKRVSVSSQHFKLPFKQSVDLVLVASREYFNSSSSAADPCMALAILCLNLIEDVPGEIEEELDLISSLNLLQEFNVSILPLQVRLCEDKVSIIQHALQKTKKAYKKSPKIMQLANLLRAWSNHQNEREGKVWTLIGEQALQVKDYAACYSAAKNLIGKGYKEGWKICYSLAECQEFDDIQSRSDLMSFALAYCTEDLIEDILENKSKLQLQILRDRVKFLMGDNAPNYDIGDLNLGTTSEQTSSSGDTFNALWQTSGKTLQVLQNTTQSTKAVLTSVSSKKFWKDAVKYLSQPTLFFSLLFCTVENILTTSNNCWIQPSALSWNNETEDVFQENNKNLSKQGVCAFYSGLIEDPHISNLEANYQRFARPDLNQSQEIAMSILQASLIEDALKTEAKGTDIIDAVLLDLAKAYISEDLAYALSLLLSLDKFEEAEVLFETLPKSTSVLQLGVLYYSLKSCIISGRSHALAEKSLLDPLSISKMVLKFVNSKDSTNVKSPEMCSAVNLLTKRNKMLYDYIQASVLQKLGGGVDTARFTTDDEYKKDTILGIAMTLDESVFHTSVSLAQHYKLPLWDLYMAHLEYLFSESRASTDDIKERFEKLKLLKKLKPNRDLLRERLVQFVYPTIDGKDHGKLAFYFSLLEQLGDKADGLLLKPSVHASLLSKLRSSAKNFDYKALMNPESSHIYLTTVIKESNVHTFAKLASNIPKPGGIFFEPENIYCLWVKKFFFEGNSSEMKVPSTKSEWINRFEACRDMIQRLSASDILEFIDNTIFTEQALEKLAIDCRAEIIKRTLKFCTQKCSKIKNDLELTSEWNSTISSLKLYQRHLQRMEDEILVQLKDSFDPKIQIYCREFDLSRSIVEKLHDLLVKVVTEGPDLDLLKTLLSLCPADVGWEPSDAYVEAIDRILKQMKVSQVSSSQLKTQNTILTLEKILEDVSCNRDELMEDMVVELLNEFCQDTTVSVSVRLSILQLLEKSNCLSDEYRELLLLYRTQAVVLSMWNDIDVSDEEVKDPKCRRILFDTLISLSQTVQHFSSLAKLLTLWPPFTHVAEQSHEDEPWTKLLCNLLELRREEALDLAISSLKVALSCPSFNLQCCQEVFKRIESQGSIHHILKFAFTTNHESLHKEAIRVLKSVPEHEVSPKIYDDDLMDLILHHSLTAQIVSTFLYKPVIEFLLQCQEDADSEENYKSIGRVVRELSAAGYDAEAGSLLLIKNSTHPALSTFSSAFYSLQRFLGGKDDL